MLKLQVRMEGVGGERGVAHGFLPLCGCSI